MKSILFVDDEVRILQGLKRLLRSMRSEWSMHFASSGPEALDYLRENEVDVIVSDMRMPGMMGDEVLKHVNAAAAYGQAAETAAKNEGMAGEMERLRAQIERQKAAAERDREMYDKPSVWEQAGAQLLQALIGMLMDVGKQKLNDWINGGGEEPTSTIPEL